VRLPTLARVTLAGPTLTRVSPAELAALADCTERMLQYRVAHGQLAPPGSDGRFDRARALAELRAKPKQRGGRKRGVKIAPTVSTSGKHGRTPVLRDPATRFRLARAGQEEIKLAKMRGTVERVAVVKPRVFHLIRGDRDRLLAWVSRVAPLVAAELRVDEGATWRAMMMTALRAFLEALAELHLPLPEAEPETPTLPADDSTPIPRDADTRFQLARARQEELKLARMRRDHVDLVKATGRLAAFRRRMLEELAGWVPRVAPRIAAEVGVEAASLAGTMERHLAPLRADLAAIDVAAALRTDPPEEGRTDVDEEPAEQDKAGNRSLAGGGAGAKAAERASVG